LGTLKPLGNYSIQTDVPFVVTFITVAVFRATTPGVLEQVVVVEFRPPPNHGAMAE
jgi:hypothetical protein